MSELRDTIGSVVADRQATLTGESAVILLAGGTTYPFTCEWEDNPPIELREGLGIDPREAGKMYVIDKIAAGQITCGGPAATVQILLYGVWQNFTALKRSQDPGSVQTCFGMALVTSKG